MIDEATAADAEEVTEVSDEEAARAIWDKAEANQPRDERGRYATAATQDATETPAEAAPVEEAPEVPEGEEAPQAAASEPPGHLPRAIKEVWGKLDETTRDVIATNQQEYAKRLSEAENIRRAAGPLYDRIVRAAQSNEAVRNMSPEQFADRVFEINEWAERLEQNPVEAIMAIAQQRGLTEHLKAAFTGEQANDGLGDLRREIAWLREQLDQRPDPNAIQSQVSQQMLEARLSAEVDAFSRSKPDWKLLEPHIEARIPQLRDANPQLEPMEVLELAYTTVSNEYTTPLRSAAAEEATKARKAEAARAAASINVQPDGAGDAPPMSEREAAKAVWDRLHG